MITAQLASRAQKPQDSAKPVGSFVLALVGMLCATFIGFVSEMRPPASPFQRRAPTVEHRSPQD
jgi:hypothetical protein